MKRIIIFGNSILARIIHFYFNRDSKFQVVGFTVDAAYRKDNSFCGLEVFDFEQITDSHPPNEFSMFIAVGPTKMNLIREKKFEEAKTKGYELVSYFSPTSICESPVGENSFLGDYAIIQPYAHVGYNNFFWEFSIVGNDSKVGSHCYLSPRATLGTFAELSDNSILGTNSVVKTSVKIAPKTLVGACCYISKDSKENGVYGERNSEFLGTISSKVDISRL